MSAEAIKIYHGGARQIPMRWPNVAGAAPQRLSFYEILPGEVCTRHVHTGKAETWVVVSGFGVATIGDNVFPVSRGDALVTDPGTAHDLANTGDQPLVFLNLVTLTGGQVTTTELTKQP